MKRSTQRILTTHTGSLPRPDDLVQMMFDKEEGKLLDEATLADRVQSAVAETVRQEVAAGIDVISDGEMGKLSFVGYVKDRLTGFGGESAPFLPRDMLDHPDMIQRAFGAGTRRRVHTPACDGPVAVRDQDAVQRDIENFQAALQGVEPEEAFMCAASPGVIAQVMANTYYPSHEAYLYALADAMRDEYKAIVAAGFMLQVDCPDLAMERHLHFADVSLDAFRRHVQQNVEVLNYALAGIPAEQARVHVCWGNYAGPHHRDVPLKEIIDLLLEIRVNALSIEAANPRHEHEWKVFETVRLPEGKVLIPGVIDTVTNHIEHPELVAQRIVRWAKLVGRENVIAGTDCGFGTFVGTSAVVSSVAWAKLQTLAEGARLASQELW
jgi:5-methyltetrahydropteroyltriglutamate--homocysteine methyltransferase